MAIVDSKKVNILWRLFNDPIVQANKEQFIGQTAPRKLGSSISAVNSLLANGDELKVLMRTILGVDPNSNSSNWDKIVRNYWDSLSVDVYANGLEIEIGFIYDIEDSEHASAIKKLMNEVKSITSDKSLMEYVKGFNKSGKANVPDNKKYLYATPINPQDWLLYRYCVGIDGKGYRDVANDLKSIENSPHIRFYIYDEAIANEIRKKKYEISRDALKKYIDVIAKRDIVDELLLMFGVSIDNKEEKNKEQEDMDKDMTLNDKARENPELFLEYANDSALKIKATIEKYIMAGILRRIAGTSMIVDGKQPDVIIGTNIAEAVTYFSPENIKNKTNIDEYSTKYKALKLG